MTTYIVASGRARGPLLAEPGIRHLSDRRTAALAGCLVAALLASLWLFFGVPAADAAAFAAYELALVALPGILLYRALAPRAGGLLRQIAIGWPLGYAIAIAAFIATASVDARGLFPVLPLLAAAIAATLLWRRRGGSPRTGQREISSEEGGAILPPAAVWAIAAAIGIALIYLAVGYFALNPLPGEVDSVSYHVDNVYDIALAAEAEHHWPMQEPGVHEADLRYYVYAFVEIAGASQVTGVEPATLVLRLFPAALIVLVALQVASLGRELARSAWVAPLAVALVLLAGELDLDPERSAPFGDTFFVNLPLSPTFLFAIPPFLAVVALLLRALRAREPLAVGEWAIVGALVLLCGGAKAMTLPVLLGGLGIWVIWARWQRRAVAPGLIAIALVLSATLVSYVAFFSGGEGGFRFALFQFTETTVIEEFLDPAGSVADALVTVAGGVVAVVALVVPSLGIVWVLRERGLRLDPGQALLLALFAASVIGFCLTDIIATGQAYFLHYGYIAGCVLSAQGIAGFLEHHRRRWRWRTSVLAVLVAGGIAAAVVYVPGPEVADATRLGAGYAIAALAVVLVAVWGARSAAGTLPTAGAVLLLVIALGLLNTPLDDGFPYAQAVRSQSERYVHAPDDPDANRGLTRDLHEGLRWVRENSDEDDVIAVNNHSRDAAGFDSRYFYYTAFTERRALLESWLHTLETRARGYEAVLAGETPPPFEDLRELNSDALRGEPDALATVARDYGVDFVLVDKVHGSASPRLRAVLGDPAFENPALVVYALDERTPATSPR